jgi:hypothetical protein
LPEPRTSVVTPEPPAILSSGAVTTASAFPTGFGYWEHGRAGPLGAHSRQSGIGSKIGMRPSTSPSIAGAMLHCRQLPLHANCGLMHRSNQHPIRSPRRRARAALPALRGAERLRRVDPSATSTAAPHERRRCCRRARRERANPLRLRRHLENGSIPMSRLYQRTISARAVPAYPNA